MANADSRQIVARITSLFQAGYNADTLAAEIDKMRPAPSAGKTAKARTTAFTRGEYSFRPVRYMPSDNVGWEVWRAGARQGRHASPLAQLYPASDGISWSVQGLSWLADARPSFSEACDLVMARLPREGA